MEGLGIHLKSGQEVLTEKLAFEWRTKGLRGSPAGPGTAGAWLDGLHRRPWTIPVRCTSDGLTGDPWIPEKDPGRNKCLVSWQNGGHLGQPWAVAGLSGRTEGAEVRTRWAGSKRHVCTRQFGSAEKEEELQEEGDQWWLSTKGSWRLRIRARLLDLIRAVSGEDRISKCRGLAGTEGWRRDWNCDKHQEMLVSENRWQRQPSPNADLGQEVANATPFPSKSEPPSSKVGPNTAHPSRLSPGAPPPGGSTDVYSRKVPLHLSVCSLCLSTWPVVLSSPCDCSLWLISPASLGEHKQLGVLPHTWRSSADLEGMDEWVSEWMIVLVSWIARLWGGQKAPSSSSSGHEPAPEPEVPLASGTLECQSCLTWNLSLNVYRTEWLDSRKCWRQEQWLLINNNSNYFPFKLLYWAL